MCCQTFVVWRSTHFFISQEIKPKKNIMNSTIQTEWIPDDPPSPGSPWITNTDSFSGHFDNLEGRCTFITWALGKHCYSIQGISNVLQNISDFSREPDRHVSRINHIRGQTRKLSSGVHEINMTIGFIGERCDFRENIT